jgi:hypothetical protein
LKPTFIDSYIGRGNTYAQTGDKASAKLDFEKLLTLNPNNQQAKDAIASLQIETPTIRDARIFLDDAQKFVAQQSTVPPSISQIATAAASLTIALTKFDEGATAETTERLNDLLNTMNGFQEFRARKQDDRGRERTQRLAEASNEGTNNLVCIDNMLKTNLVDPKNTSLAALRVTIDVAIQKQDIDDIVKANGAFQLYAKDNVILCQLTVPAPSIADTPLLKVARLYLDDGQKFLNTRRNIDEDKIMQIAREAKTLQDAIGRFDQVTASQSRRQLDDLLRPIDGFVKYVSDNMPVRLSARGALNRRCVATSCSRFCLVSI